MRKCLFFLFFIICGLIIFIIGWRSSQTPQSSTHVDGQRAYQDVLVQVSYGPRIPDSLAHSKTITYIQEQLHKAGWKTQIQKTNWKGFSVQNIIASNTNQTTQIILGAHYDSRILADQDTGQASHKPVPGADDGASGVAVLLELARTLPHDGKPINLVFFDAEDNGGLEGRDWIMGSRAFVNDLKVRPRAVIIVDMVGDADLNLYIERNSDAALVAEIWQKAAKLGYGRQFIQTAKDSLLDDHTPFMEAGIPAVDIIDFDYAFWHTIEDTPDKVSPESLQIVSETLLAWISTQK